MMMSLSRTRTKPLDKLKKQRLRARPNQVTAKVFVTCSLDPGAREPVMGWGGKVLCKELGMNRVFFSEIKLADLVGAVSESIRQKMKELQGAIPSVDVIFRMPMGSDHRLTICYEADTQMQEILDETRDGDLNCYE